MHRNSFQSVLDTYREDLIQDAIKRTSEKFDAAILSKLHPNPIQKEERMNPATVRQTVGTALPAKKDRNLDFIVEVSDGQGTFDEVDTFVGTSVRIKVGNYEVYVTTGAEHNQICVTTWQNVLNDRGQVNRRDMVSQITGRGLDLHYNE